MPLSGLLAAMDRPASGLAWLEMRPGQPGNAAQMLRQLGLGQIPLTHDAFRQPRRRPRPPRRSGRRGRPAGQPAAGAHDQAAALLARDPAAHAPWAIQAAWPVCWSGCGRWASTSRPPRWPAGCQQPAGSTSSSSSSSDKALQISSVSDGRPTAPRPRRGLGRPGLMACSRPRDREATLPVGLRPTRRIRKVSLDSSLSGRPELHCEAHLSAPAPRSLHSDRTLSVLSGVSWQSPRDHGE